MKWVGPWAFIFVFPVPGTDLLRGNSEIAKQGWRKKESLGQPDDGQVQQGTESEQPTLPLAQACLHVFIPLWNRHLLSNYHMPRPMLSHIMGQKEVYKHVEFYEPGLVDTLKNKTTTTKNFPLMELSCFSNTILKACKS